MTSSPGNGAAFHFASQSPILYRSNPYRPGSGLRYYSQNAQHIQTLTEKRLQLTLQNSIASCE